MFSENAALIIDLNFDNYITTNYDYAFRNTVNKDIINENNENIFHPKKWEILSKWYKVEMKGKSRVVAVVGEK